MKGHNQENGVRGFSSPQGKPKGLLEARHSERKSKSGDHTSQSDLQSYLLFGNSRTEKTAEKKQDKPEKAKKIAQEKKVDRQRRGLQDLKKKQKQNNKNKKKKEEI